MQRSQPIEKNKHKKSIKQVWSRTTNLDSIPSSMTKKIWTVNINQSSMTTMWIMKFVYIQFFCMRCLKFLMEHKPAACQVQTHNNHENNKIMDPVLDKSNKGTYQIHILVFFFLFFQFSLSKYVHTCFCQVNNYNEPITLTYKPFQLPSKTIKFCYKVVQYGKQVTKQTECYSTP